VAFLFTVLYSLTKYFLVLVALLICDSWLFAQQPGNPTTSKFQLFEDSLLHYSRIVLSRKPQPERETANEQVKKWLTDFLKESGSYQHTFDSLRTMAVLISEDKAFKLYNWELPNADGTFIYFCVVQFPDGNFLWLKDNRQQIKRAERANLTPDNWMGAHYYKIIKVKHRKQKYYVLLGADWNNRQSKKKIIDAMVVDKNQKITFGLPVFEINKMFQHRIVFEYSADVAMSVRYDDKKDLIIFDHLSPLNPSQKGQYQFYAPDLSYDALQLKKGKWRYIENIDARNEKTKWD
jgi:hypothetical protein